MDPRSKFAVCLRKETNRFHRAQSVDQEITSHDQRCSPVSVPHKVMRLLFSASTFFLLRVTKNEYQPKLEFPIRRFCSRKVGTSCTEIKSKQRVEKASPPVLPRSRKLFHLLFQKNCDLLRGSPLRGIVLHGHVDRFHKRPMRGVDVVGNVAIDRRTFSR